jgi:hypothetical protein
MGERMKHDGNGEGMGSDKEETGKSGAEGEPQKSVGFVSKQNTLGPQRTQSMRHRAEGHVTQEKGGRGKEKGEAQGDRTGEGDRPASRRLASQSASQPNGKSDTERVGVPCNLANSSPRQLINSSTRQR